MTIVGIDLGTTNSLVSVFESSKARIIPNVLGERLTPSVVSIDESGEILVGKAARDRLITHPEKSAALFKRHMGSEKRYLLGNEEFRPEELASLVLRSLKADAEAYLNEPVTEAVISVPAYFNDIQRKATRTAG
jgi:molecular chaperone HscC